MNFKKITDDIASRLSAYIISAFTIFACYFLQIKSGVGIELWQVFFGGYNDDIMVPCFCMLTIALISLIFLAIILIENKTGWKFKHKIVQNWFVKLIIITLILYYAIFLFLPSAIITACVLFTLIFG